MPCKDSNFICSI